MLVETSTPKAIQESIFHIVTLSPLAKNMIDTESYRDTAMQDGADHQYILDLTFDELLKDLAEIGVILTLNSSDLTQDLHRLNLFLSVLNYLMPNTLYPLLKVNHSLRDCVEHIMTGSLGQEEETPIQTYLTELGGLEGSPPLYPDMTDQIEAYYPYFSQTETFTDYLKNFLDLLSHEKITISSDDEAHDAYRQYLRTTIGKLSDAVNLFSNEADYPSLCRLQDYIIKDFTAPINFIDYHYLFTTAISSLPEDLLPSFDNKIYQYKVSHPWCSDYYKLRRLDPSPTQILMIYCFLYATCIDQEHYISEAKALSQSSYHSAPAYLRIQTLWDHA